VKAEGSSALSLPLVPPENPGTVLQPPASLGPKEEVTLRRPLPMRWNFAWILGGNVVYAACQLITIVVLAKFGSSFVVGQYALGVAIATPVLIFTNLQLRAVLATDSQRIYSFPQYFRLRTLMTTLGLIIVAALVAFGGYGRETAIVIVAIALAKGIESLTDIHYGLFQLNERLDHSGRSMIVRGISSVVAMSVGVCVFRSLIWGCAGLVLVWLGNFLLLDIRNGRRFVADLPAAAGEPREGWHWKLIWAALPLGIATTMAALNLNIPRYFIHARLGEHQVGIYSALAYSTVAIVLVSDSMAHCAIPRLSRYYAKGKLAEYRGLLIRLLMAGAALGIVGLTLARLLGEKLLTRAYGREYATESRVFVVLVLGAAIYCVACMLTTAITSAHYFRIQLPLYTLVAGSNALACAAWVPRAGIAGGAAAMVVAASVHLLLASVVLMKLLRSPGTFPKCLEPSNAGVPAWKTYV